jgi:type IV secretory pathway VirB2 component (pilin)
VNLVLQTKTVLQTFSATAGATVAVGTQGATVALPANGYKDGLGNPYSGQVQVSARFVNTATPNFVAIAPGTMSATNAQGKAVQLATYGMMEVLLTAPSGAALQLANGKKATITSPIDDMQNAPATIPMWYLDESTGLWKEEGVGTKQGNMYIGEVAHFTFWNYDLQSNRATIKGRVVDCNGNPVANLEVYGKYGYELTDGNGYFEGFVPAGIATTLRFNLYTGTCSLSTYNHTENIAPLSDGQVYQIGNINAGCPNTTSFKTITGHVEGCNGQTIATAGVIVAGRFTLIDANGNFRITVCTTIGTNITVSATTLDDFYTTTVAIGTANTYDIGTITLCGNTSGIAEDNEFTINGDGFVNQRVIYTYTSDSSNFAALYSLISSSNNLSRVHLTTKKIVATDNWLTGTNNKLGLNDLYISSRGLYYPVSGTISTTSVTATEIIGTYSGTVRNASTNATATITNGRFRARR